MKRFLQIFFICIIFSAASFAQNPNGQVIRLKHRLEIGAANDRVKYASFSADGKKVLLVNENSTQIWSAETGKPLLTFPEKIAIEKGFQFLWQPNGSKILQFGSLVGNAPAYLWNAENGKLVDVLNEIKGVEHAEWNKNGDRILTVGDSDYSIDADKKFSFSIRDENGKPIRTDSVKTGTVFLIKFTNDGKKLIASYRVNYRYDFKEKPIRIYDAETGAPIKSFDEELKKSSFDYAVFSAESPDGRFICGQILDSKGVVCWKTEGGEAPIYYFLDTKETGDILFLSFSPDSKSFAVSKPKKKIIEIIDAETGKVKTTLENPNKARLDYFLSPIPQSGNTAIGDSWSPTSKFFVAGNFEKEANVWNAKTGALVAKLPLIFDDDHDWFVGTLVSDYETFSFHPSEKILLSVSNQVVRLWKPETGELLQEIKESGKDKSRRLFQRFVARWSPGGNLLMTAANENKSVLLWEVLPVK